MTVVVYILGAVLVLAGAIAIGTGMPIVRLEIGWSEVIAGAVAGSAGFVIMALGAVMSRLEAIHRSILAMPMPVALRGSIEPDDERVETPVPPHPILASIHPLAPVREPLTSAPDRPVRPDVRMSEALPQDTVAPDVRVNPPHEDGVEHDRSEVSTARVALESEDLPPPSLATAIEPPVPPEAIRPRSSFMASFLARRSAGLPPADPMIRADPLMEPMPSREASDSLLTERTRAEDQFDWPEPARTAAAGGSFEQVLEAREADDRETRLAEPASSEEREHGHEEAAEPADPDTFSADDVLVSDPVVVGRYNAGSASYVMYSNGMIEVETETGTHRFASMQELKAFIERRDSI